MSNTANKSPRGARYDRMSDEITYMTTQIGAVSMRILKHSSIAILLAVALIAALPGTIPAGAQGGGASTPVHLVATVSNDGDARINRMDWDVNAFALVFPGTGVRSNDYIDLTGRTTLSIICTDLTLIEQRGSESPRCGAYPSMTAFFYTDDPAWVAPDASPVIHVLSGGAEGIPAEITDPGQYQVSALDEASRERVSTNTSTILGLNVPAEVQAYALSQYYRGEGMWFDAIGALTALPDLGCTARRAFVEVPADGSRTLESSPVVYIRLGEMFQVIGQTEDAARYYQCAAEAGEAYGDPASVALANARWANVAPALDAAIERYQIAIDNYAALGAADSANVMMELCGMRNCTLE